MLENAQTALNLDPDSGAAHTALAYLDDFVLAMERVRRPFRCSVGVESQRSRAAQLLCDSFESSQGRYREAMLMAERILELSPPSRDVALSTFGSRMCIPATSTRRSTFSARRWRSIPRTDAARINLGYINARRGNARGGRTRIPPRRGIHGRPSVPDYDRGSGLWLLENRLRGRGQERCSSRLRDVADERSIGAGTWVLAYLAIGEEQQALEALDDLLEKIENHQPDSGWFDSMVIKHNVTGDPVLEEPRFKERRDRIRGS